MGDSFQNAMDRPVGLLPNLLACLVIFMIAATMSALATRFLRRG